MIVKLGNLSKLTNEDVFLTMNTGSALGKVAFDLVQNAKSFELLMGDRKLSWDKLVNKNMPHFLS